MIDMNIGDVIFGWLQNVADWLRDHSRFWKTLIIVGDRSGGALEKSPPDIAQAVINEMGMMTSPSAQAISVMLSRITGKSVPPEAFALHRDHADMMRDPAKYIEGAIQDLANSPALTIPEDLLGTIVYDFIIAPMEKQLELSIYDPKAFQIRVHGVLTAVMITGHIISLAAEITGLGQIQSVAQMFSDLYRNLGFESISAGILEPIFAVGVKFAGERYYNKKFRPRRFAGSDLMQAYFHKLIDVNTFIEEMRVAGYREEDIPRAIDIAQTRPSVSNLINAFNIGMISDVEAVNEITLRGYSLEDARWLIEMALEQHTFDAAQQVITTAQRVARKQIVSLDKYRSILAAAHYPPERVELEVATLALDMELTKKELSTTQVKDAFDHNLITEIEAIHYLQQANIDLAAITLMLQTWKADARPKVKELNEATISQAYISGLLTRSQAADKLKSVGYSDADANFLLQLAERRTTPGGRQLTEGMIVTGMLTEMLTRDEAFAKLQEIGFSDVDADFILRASMIVGAQMNRLLPDSTVVKLVKLGFMDPYEALARLMQTGFSENDAELYLAAELTAAPAAAKTIKSVKTVG